MHSIGEWDKRVPFIWTPLWRFRESPSLDTQCYNKNKNKNSMIAPMPLCLNNFMQTKTFLIVIDSPSSHQPFPIRQQVDIKLEDDVLVLLGSQDIGRGIIWQVGRFWCYGCFRRLFTFNILALRKG